MSSNGVIRIGRKGLKKFAFGEDGEPFEVDIVEAFNQWVIIDDRFRQPKEGEEALPPDELRSVHLEDMPAYYNAAVEFVQGLIMNSPEAAVLQGTNEGAEYVPPQITRAEALDFIARLREQYNELADFFVPRSRKKPDSPDTSETASLQFSEEDV